MKPLYRLLLILTCGLLLAGCAKAEEPERVLVAETEPVLEAETVPTEEDDSLSVRHLEAVITESDIPKLDDYPNLQTLDLSGSTCYTAIVVYAKSHPDITVTYTVDLGGTAADNWVTELELTDDKVDYELLLRNLVYLPQLQSIHLPGTTMTADQIAGLREAYPDIAITYSVSLLGNEVDAETEELDLSNLTSEQIDRIGSSLANLENLRYVELASGDTRLTKQDVKHLTELAPGVQFHYVFSLFGKTISTTDETVSYKNLKLTEDDIPALRDALGIMSGCKAFILENCGLSSEKLAEIREDFPNTELVWRVYFGVDSRYSYLTNAETIRAVYNVTDSTCHELRYCRGVKYMDIGHNETLTDLSFVGYLPNLEILIASGCAVSDLSGFGNCKKLEFLELAFCGKLKDLTPLSDCSGLKNLNICYTKVSSLMPLDPLPLERLFCKRTQVPASEQKIFKEVHEGCIATFVGKEAYAGPGWRYEDNGKTFTEIYKKVREVFHYDEADKLIEAGSK